LLKPTPPVGEEAAKTPESPPAARAEFASRKELDEIRKSLDALKQQVEFLVNSPKSLL
jgi:hypothetical protein